MMMVMMMPMCITKRKRINKNKSKKKGFPILLFSGSAWQVFCCIVASHSHVLCDDMKGFEWLTC